MAAAFFLLDVHFEEEITRDQPLSLQLYSEYRSTYKWHEFTPAPNAAAVTASAASEVVVKKPPKPITGRILH